MAKNNNYENTYSYMGDGSTEHLNSGKFTLSNKDFELFDENRNKPSDVVRVKRTSTNLKGERWRIFLNDKVAFTIEGSKITKKDCAFLRTVEGTTWIMREFKASPFKNVSEFKTRLKNNIENISCSK